MKFKERFHRLEILLVISLLVILVGIISIRMIDFSKEDEVPKIVSFIFAESMEKNLSLELHQSQIFSLLIEDPFEFTSFRLSGFIEGEGPVQIFLENSGEERLLIYTNIREKIKPDDLITGLVSSDAQEKTNKDTSLDFTLRRKQIIPQLNLEITEDQELKEGVFYNECAETCFIDASFSQTTNYRLVFYIGENVKLRLNKLVYTKN